MTPLGGLAVGYNAFRAPWTCAPGLQMQVWQKFPHPGSKCMLTLACRVSVPLTSGLWAGRGSAMCVLLACTLVSAWYPLSVACHGLAGMPAGLVASSWAAAGTAVCFGRLDCSTVGFVVMPCNAVIPGAHSRCLLTQVE